MTQLLTEREVLSFGADVPKAGESQRVLFRDFLSRELAELQGRVLQEFEHQVNNGLQTGAWKQDPATVEFPAGDEPSRQCSSGSEFLADPLERWSTLVSNLLVEDEFARPGGMTMANLTVKLVASNASGEPSFRRSSSPEEEEEEQEGCQYNPHADWLDAPSRASKAFRKIAESRINHRVSMMETVQQDFHARQQARRCVDGLVIHPDSRRRVAWCSLGVLLLVYDAFTVPMEAVSLWSASPSAILYVAPAYWIADFLAHLLTGYHHDVGVELRASRTIVHYARGWLPIDLAIIVLDVALLALDSAYGAGALRLVRMARFARLIRLHKSLDALKSYMRATESAVLDLVIRILRVLGFLMLICHLTACVWFGVGRVGDGVPDWFVEGSWVEANGLEGESDTHKYAMALHWSITQFTPATNNIVPTCTIERLFSVGVVLVGMVVFSAFLSSMTSAVNELKSFSTARTKDRLKLVTYMKSRSVSPDLSHRVLFFFDAQSSHSPVVVENDLPMLCQLPESARICLHGELYLPLLRATTIVSHLYSTDRRPVFLDICHRAMTDRRFVAQQEIFVDGVETTCVYMVVAGKLEYSSGENSIQDKRSLMSKLSDPAGEEETSAHLLPPKSRLAECAMWLNQWHHRGSLLAHTTCSVVKLDCSVVRQTIRDSDPDLQLLQCMRCFAILFAHHVQECDVSDLGPDSEAMQDMCGRALRFCRLEPGRKPSTELEQQDTNARIMKLLRWSKASSTSAGSVGLTMEHLRRPSASSRRSKGSSRRSKGSGSSTNSIGFQQRLSAGSRMNLNGPGPVAIIEERES